MSCVRMTTASHDARRTKKTSAVSMYMSRSACDRPRRPSSAAPCTPRCRRSVSERAAAGGRIAHLQLLQIGGDPRPRPRRGRGSRFGMLHPGLIFWGSASQRARFARRVVKHPRGEGLRGSPTWVRSGPTVAVRACRAMVWQFDAGRRSEQLGAARGPRRVVGGGGRRCWCCGPGGEVVRASRPIDADAHPGVLGAAELVAGAQVGARLVDLIQRWLGWPGMTSTFAPSCGHPEVVDHVARAEARAAADVTTGMWISLARSRPRAG